MMPFSPRRIHVVLGAPWRDAVIKHMEPLTPYWPWSAASDVRPGDGVLVVFATEPRLVWRQLARVGPDGHIGTAIGELDSSWHVDPAILYPGDIATFDGGPVVIEDDDADEFMAALDDIARDGSDRFGHTSAAAARALLESAGRCESCGSQFDLMTDGAGDDIVIHTTDVQDGSDWPAALCDPCAAAMCDGGYGSFLDFQFDRHPTCPRCGGHRTLCVHYGMPSGPEYRPWVTLGGCVVDRKSWKCESCSHRW